MGHFKPIRFIIDIYKAKKPTDKSSMDFVWLKQEILKVNTAFYERVYKHPWMSKVFRKVPQEHITAQQTDFILGALGGPKIYCGRWPTDAHPHIFVDQEMWDLRGRFLKEALDEVKFPPDLALKWIRIDEGFKRAIMKNSLADCQKRFFSDEIIYEPNTATKKAA